MTVKKNKNSLIDQAAALLGEKVVTGGGATGQAQGPEPVAAQGGDAHNKRPQDKKGTSMPVQPTDNPAGTPIQQTDPANNTSPTGDMSAQNRASVAMKPVREDVDAILAGADVSEDFKVKATTIFEAAVAARVNALKVEMDTNNTAQLEEAVKQIQEDLETKINEYLEYVVEQWLEANALAVESGLRADISESFMKGLHQLFTDHHIDIPEEQVNVAEELATELDEIKAALNTAVAENIELKKTVNASERNKVVESVTNGLVETQKAKLSTLFETVEYTTQEEFKKKLEAIKDGYLAQGTSADKKAGIQNLLEQVEEVAPAGKPADTITEPQVRSYVDAISRTTRTK